MAESVFDRLLALLEARQAQFTQLRHKPVFTSQEAADVRGVSLSSGAKALICKADRQFMMFVLPANLKLNSKAVRKSAGFKSLRFATGDEVLELTSLKPGSIPPFGSLFDLPTWCDRRLANEPTINFNAGDHAISIRLSFDEYQRVESLRMGDFASE